MHDPHTHHPWAAPPWHQALGLIGWLVLTFATAAIGALASVDAGAFYAELVRPKWAPPGWLFALVWSTLYALMSVSAWLARISHRAVRRAEVT